MNEQALNGGDPATADEGSAALDPADYASLRRLATSPEHRLVVAFGGGAMAGVCGNIALAAVLEELGLAERVEAIWGTSAGAIVGGCWASGTPAARMRELILTPPPGGVVDVRYGALVAALLLRPFGRALPDGLVRGRRLARIIDAGLRVKAFERCATPFRCIACSDDGLSRRRIFRDGPLLPAILSSMSLPGIIAPRARLADEDCGYYDGGVVEKTPLISPIAEHLRLGDERKLLLVATHFGSEAHRSPTRGFVDRFIHSIYAMEDALWDYQLREARRRNRDAVTLILLNPHIVEPRLFDFRYAAAHYAQARRAFLTRLTDASLALTFGAD